MRCQRLIASILLCMFAPVALADESPAYEVYDLHVDHLGSVRLVTREDGLAVARHDFFPFGEEVMPLADIKTKMFTGHERDDETGLDYMLARYQGGTLGRFLSVDPSRRGVQLMVPLTWNRYSYVVNNPLNMVDPDGQVAIVDDIVVFGGLLLAGVATTWLASDNPSDPNRTNAHVMADSLSGLWASLFADATDSAGGEPHTANPTPSNRPKHEEGEARKKMDRGGEKGDAGRRPPRRRPKGWKGPWPPQQGGLNPHGECGDNICSQKDKPEQQEPGAPVPGHLETRLTSQSPS